MTTNEQQFWVKMEHKSDHSLQTGIESAIHNQILNNDLTIVSCVYDPLLQPDELSFNSSQS